MHNLLPVPEIMQPYLVKTHHFRLGLEGYSTVTAVPNGNIFLFIIWGKSNWDHHRVAPLRNVKKGGIYVLGQHLEINNLSTKADMLEIIGFEISPLAFHQLFGISQRLLLNGIFCLEELGIRETSFIYAQVKEEISLANQLSIMENFFWSKVQSRNGPKIDDLSQAIVLIDQFHGNVCIKRLADNIRICTRSLERMFMEVLGVSPKTYCKIIQFNYAYRLFTQTDKKIVDIALDAGYYDQSHFVNHFKKVFGKCPSKFWAEHPSLFNNRNSKLMQTNLQPLSGYILSSL